MYCQKSKLKYVDFRENISYAFTKIEYMEYFGARTKPIKDWIELYLIVWKCVYSDFPEIISSESDAIERIIETELTASDVADRIRLLLDKCKIPYENVVIAYYIDWDGKILSVLNHYFVNGIRKDSALALDKLRRKYSEEYSGEQIPADINLKEFLLRNSVEYNGKYYIVSDKDKTCLYEMITKQVFLGNNIFFYDELYQTHRDFFDQIHIFNEYIMREILENVLDTFFFCNSFFSTEKNCKLENAIAECFCDMVVMTCEQMKEKLRYVPLDKIKTELRTSSLFTWVRQNEYACIDVIILDEEEAKEIQDNVHSIIEKKGFVSLAQMDVSRTLMLNPALSEYAARSAIYAKLLDPEFDKNGNILTRKGEKINVSAILREYCLSNDYLTDKQIIEYEESIVGARYHRALFIASECMVRIDRNHFVNPDLVEFDVENTDRALSLYIGDRVVPLRYVTSFTSFPYVVEYSWNLFLLESYCRLFSKKYKYQCLSVNSKNVGAIYPAERKFNDYMDVMAEAVVTADVALLQKNVGEFLSEQGYIARRTDAIHEVIIKAQAIMSQGG